jgi:hypothetical protein
MGSLLSRIGKRNSFYLHGKAGLGLAGRGEAGRGMARQGKVMYVGLE